MFVNNGQPWHGKYVLLFSFVVWWKLYLVSWNFVKRSFYHSVFTAQCEYESCGKIHHQHMLFIDSKGATWIRCIPQETEIQRSTNRKQNWNKLHQNEVGVRRWYFANQVLLQIPTFITNNRSHQRFQVWSIQLVAFNMEWKNRWVHWTVHSSAHHAIYNQPKRVRCTHYKCIPFWYSNLSSHERWSTRRTIKQWRAYWSINRHHSSHSSNNCWSCCFNSMVKKKKK